MSCPTPKIIKPAAMDDPDAIIKSLREISLDVLSRVPILNDDKRFKMSMRGNTNFIPDGYPRMTVGRDSVYWELNRATEIHFYYNEEAMDGNLDKAMISYEYTNFQNGKKHLQGQYRYLPLHEAYALVLGLFSVFNQKKGNRSGKDAKA